jgi:flagellar protein FlaG
MSMTIAGGGSVSSERIIPLDAPNEGTSTTSTTSTTGTGTPVPIDITKVTDLKKAELRGENYNISDEQLVKSIEKALRAVAGKTTSLHFSVHEKTKLIAVKVLDADTGEVIREIPPEKTLDFVAKLWEMAGLFVDERR